MIDVPLTRRYDVFALTESRQERRRMEDRKLTVKALAAMMKVNIAKLAEMADISPQHLMGVSCGRAKMTARDIIKLAETCNVSPHLIDYGE